MPHVLFTETTDNYHHLHGFTNGNEASLAYVYHHAWKPLLRHGLRILPDEFAVSSILQEAFLKGWEFRQTMESMPHIYFFIRQQLTWQCFGWYKKPVSRFYRNVVFSEFIENYADDFWEQEPEPINKADKENWRIIQKALPCLPADRQAVMLLYFKHGLTYKKIARRFGVPASSVSEEVRESLMFLKKIIHAPAESSVAARPVLRHQQELPAGMDAEMLQVFRLRYEQKQSFAAIAAQMNLPQPYVQLQYVAAHEMINALKLKTNHKQSLLSCKETSDFSNPL